MSKSAPSTGPIDLLERWLAYHEEDTGAPGRAGGVPLAAPEGPQPLPAADAPSAVEAGRVVLEALAERTEAPDDPVGADLPGGDSRSAAEQEPEPAAEQEPEAAAEEGPQAAAEEEPEPATGQEPQAATEEEPEAATGQEPQAATEQEPQAATEQEPQAATEQEPSAGTDEGSGPAPEVLGSAPDTARSDAPRQEVPSDPSVGHALIPPARPDRPAAESQAAPPAPAPAPTRSPTPTRRPPLAPMQGPVRFPPRRGGRRALTALSVAAMAGAVGTAYAAWTSRTPVTIGAAVGLAAVAWLLWGARSRATGTEMSIEDGVLRIVHGTSRYQFPLAGSHPPIDIVGEPGDRKWRVLIQRRSMAPFTIDRRMVDPAAFCEALRRYRPQA